MNATTRLLLLGGGVLVAGGWFAFSTFGGAAPRAAQAAVTAPAYPQPVVNSFAEKPRLGIDLPGDTTWPPDPFRTKESTPKMDNEIKPLIAAPDLPDRPFVLKAILDGEDPRAIVDGQVVAVGDRLPGGETVARIDALTVTLTDADGRDVVLRLPD